MGKKVREQSVSLSSYLKSVNSEDISENQDVQRMFCWDNAAINELITTVLTEDYIPPIILGEEELGGSLTQQYIVDGIQRTTALNKFRHMNWKTTKSFENSTIQYQAKRRDENGHLVKDENGSVLWDFCEFDIRNKTFDQLPEELKKKFDDYQIRIVVHQNCTMQEISKLVRRYNRNKAMGTNQKALTWIPTYARKIKNIVDSDFYKNCVVYSEAMRKNGSYEQLVSNSVITVFHKNEWKKAPKDRNEYLEEHSCEKEFDTIKEYGDRIAKICLDKFQDIFSFKDIPVWFAVFDKFTKFGLADDVFAKFLEELRRSLHGKNINGVSYDSLNEEKGTSDKRVISLKISTYTALMNEFLNIDETKNVGNMGKNEDENSDESVLSFVRENINSDITEEDIEFYRDVLEDCVKINSSIYQKCFKELIAITAYACQTERDREFESWIQQYDEKELFFVADENFIKMKDDFSRYVDNIREEQL